MKIVKYVITIAMPDIASENLVVEQLLDAFRYQDPNTSECTLCTAEMDKLGEPNEPAED